MNIEKKRELLFYFYFLLFLIRDVIEVKVLVYYVQLASYEVGRFVFYC